MTPDQIVLKMCALVPGGDERTTRLYLRFTIATLIEHFYDARRHNGQRVVETDPIGVREWLSELLDAATPITKASAPVRARISEFNETCHRCGHVHQGDRECGEQMGAGRTCRCELDVAV